MIPLGVDLEFAHFFLAKSMHEAEAFAPKKKGRARVEPATYRAAKCWDFRTHKQKTKKNVGTSGRTSHPRND